MIDYRFVLPVQIRYGDLDPQWHVNNARSLTFMENARAAYLMNLGLFDGESFFDLGLIVANINIAYIAPIKMTEKIEIAMRVVRLGTKSIPMEFVIRNVDTGEIKTKADIIMVTFDYHTQKSVPIWPEWREKISAFEGIPPGP